MPCTLQKGEVADPDSVECSCKDETPSFDDVCTFDTIEYGVWNDNTNDQIYTKGAASQGCPSIYDNFPCTELHTEEETFSGAGGWEGTGHEKIMRVRSTQRGQGCDNPIANKQIEYVKLNPVQDARSIAINFERRTDFKIRAISEFVETLAGQDSLTKHKQQEDEYDHGFWGGCAWAAVSDKTFCNSDNKDWSHPLSESTRCGGAQGESVAGKCKSGRPGDQGDGFDSIGLGFFGRNFLFASVNKETVCDTARTCETNSFGNPIG